jgi:hypothetical protein
LKNRALASKLFGCEKQKALQNLDSIEPIQCDSKED